MDFNLSKEQKDIQKAAMEFAKGEFDYDKALELDQKQQFPMEIWEKACDLGFIGLHFPEACGGADFGPLENALVAEAFCREDSGIGMALALSDFGSELIMRSGSENQKKNLLPAIAQGEKLFTLGVLEDSDALSSFETEAVRNGDGYVVNGEKSFVPLGDLADTFVIACETNKDDPGSQTLLLIEKEMKGLHVLPMGERVGMRMVPMARVSLHAVRVPEDHLVGRDGKGLVQLKDFFNYVRVETAGMAVGIAQGALDMALEYGKKREAFGKAIIRFDAIRNKLADMVSEVELARLLTYKAAWSLGQRRPDHRAIILSKMIASKAARLVTHDALQIHGGQGYMKEARIEQFFRDAKVLDLFLESGQVGKNLIADGLAGARRWTY